MSTVRDRGPQKLKSITEEIFDTVGTADMRRRLRLTVAIERAWSSMVGEAAAANVEVVGLRQDFVLVVRAATAAWMHEFSCLKRTVLTRVRALQDGQVIKDIVVRPAGRRRAPFDDRQQVVRRLPERTVTDEERRRVDDVIDGVTDPELQRALKRLFERSLTKGRHVNRRNAP